MAGYLWQLQYGMHVNVVLLFVMAFAATTDGQGRGKGAGLSSGLAESCEMIVEMCSSLYKRKLYDGGGDYSDERINIYVTRKTCVKSHAKQEVYDFVVETLKGLVAAMITNSQQKPITRDRPLLHLHQCIFV
ncbi:hypothetical protein P5673_005125 [Acropora cervicornis]|uniref:Uncharacterized protein n=1 Tax=Acropora cervicornis TaxID=6130 RepID=A0AAD9VDX1_ACRCE|nr:hypothetical protein P5673_005125 [Acropora cervicornis]